MHSTIKSKMAKTRKTRGSLRHAISFLDEIDRLQDRANYYNLQQTPRGRNPYVKQHLRDLEDLGLVSSRRQARGRRISNVYEVSPRGRGFLDLFEPKKKKKK